MNFIKTEFEGLYIIEPKVFQDKRGYFFESYNQKMILEHGISGNFIQDNESMSEYGVIRGLHYQEEPFAQTKLVRATVGKILDVVLDIRRNSKSFGQFLEVELSSDNKYQLYVPKGFAHGFSVLSQYAIVNYKCDSYYNKNAELGVNLNDPLLNINWKIENEKQIISEKDLEWPNFKDAKPFIQ